MAKKKTAKKLEEKKLATPKGKAKKTTKTTKKSKKK